MPPEDTLTRTKRKLVYGVGINDANYTVAPLVDGKQVRCPYYRAWKSMLERCYSSKFHATRPTYVGCSVAPEWHSFMAFREWMEGEDWQGMELDKDLLVPGNKVYGPDTCMFVSQNVNKVLTDHGAARGDCPIGVHWYKRTGKYEAHCKDGTGKQVHLGYFTCKWKAHAAWVAFKRTVIVKVANRQKNPRIRAAVLAWSWEFDR